MTSVFERGVDNTSYEAVSVGRGSAERDEFMQDANIWAVKDPIEQTAHDMYEQHYPGDIDNEQKRSVFVADFVGDDSYGEWFYFPWSGELVRYPEENDHYDLRTSRNRNLITYREQRKLREAKIAAFGLSVGSNIVNSFVQHGIGNNILVGDFDELAPTNLNRIRSSYQSVGLRKDVILGRQISEVDPFIKQVHLPNGYDKEAENALREFRPNLIVEEMDDFIAKVALRKAAADLRAPLLMAGDVGTNATLDIERYDLEEDKAPFNGKLGSKLQKKLDRDEPLTDRERQKALIKVNGVRNLSPRLVDSALDIGQSVSGMPQLGAIATIGGGLSALAAQEILLDRKMKSGSYAIRTNNILHVSSPDSLADNVAVLRRYIKQAHAAK